MFMLIYLSSSIYGWSGGHLGFLKFLTGDSDTRWIINLDLLKTSMYDKIPSSETKLCLETRLNLNRQKRLVLGRTADRGNHKQFKTAILDNCHVHGDH